MPCVRATNASSTARFVRSADRGRLPRQPGYDPLMQAFAGLISITGEPDRPGVRVGASVIDLGTGVWAALGILAALLERASTGRGREVSVALYDTALSLVGYQLAAVLRSGVVPGRHGTAFPLIVPYEVFPTSDGELMIAAANDGLFRLLCERIGLAELADDPRFLTNPDRIANREQLLPAIRDRLAADSSAHWLVEHGGDPRRAHSRSRSHRRASPDARQRNAPGRRRCRGGRLAAPGRR